MNALLLAGGAALLVSIVAVRLVLARADRIGAIVDPSAERWGDRRVPKIGGLGIVSAIVVGCLVAPGLDPTRASVLVAIVAASMLGLADDVGSISPRRRLAVQAVIGLALGASIGRDMGPAAVAMAVLGLIGVVALANFTNLVDNADGLATSLSLVSALTIIGIGLAVGLAHDSLVVAAAVAGATLGFLAWNRPPARIFMGDCGSLMLGTALAGAGLMVLHGALASELSTLLVVVALPIAAVVQAGDVALVVVSRVRRGVSPIQGGVDHTSHRLLRAGLGPWQMLAAIVGPAALAGAIIVAAVRTDEPAVVGVATVAIIGSVLVGEAVLARSMPYEPETATSRGSPPFLSQDPPEVPIQ